MVYLLCRFILCSYIAGTGRTNYRKRVIQQQTISSIKEERIIITKLAENKSSIYASINRKDINVARGIKNLIGKGVVFKKDTRYILADPIFELWIQKNVLL